MSADVVAIGCLRDRLVDERRRLVLALASDEALSLLPLLATVETALLAVLTVERELTGQKAE